MRSTSKAGRLFHAIVPNRLWGLVRNTMAPSTVAGLVERGHEVEVIQDSYQDFGAGQFIWRAGDPKVEGYICASDARRDGQVAGF